MKGSVTIAPALCACSKLSCGYVVSNLIAVDQVTKSYMLSKGYSSLWKAYCVAHLIAAACTSFNTVLTDVTLMIATFLCYRKNVKSKNLVITVFHFWLLDGPALQGRFQVFRSLPMI